MQSRMKNEYFIIGYGKFGSEIVKTLTDNGLDVVVIDNNQQLVDKAAETVSFAICADGTDIDELQQTGIAKAQTIIVAISDVQVSILTCANLIQLAAKGNIIARAMNITHKRVLKTMGIEHVTVPEVEVAHRVALQAMYRFNESIHNITDGFSWTRITVSNIDVIDKPIKDLDIRSSLGATILFVRHNGKPIFPIDPETKLDLGDIVAVMCPNYNLGKVFDYFTDPMFKGQSRQAEEKPIVKVKNKIKNTQPHRKMKK